MRTPQMGAAKRFSLFTVITALAIGLSGCYNVAGSVRFSGTSAEESTARVTFQGSILEERLSQGVPIERTASGERDETKRLEFLRNYFDGFMDCCGNPPWTMIHYVGVGGEAGTYTPPNGRMMLWSDVPVAEGATFRTESFGGLNLSLLDDYVVVRASMTLPRDRTGEATGGQFEVSYPDNWRLVSSNGEATVNQSTGEDAVFWSGKPGERIDITAAFEVYKQASDVPQLLISPLVDANGNEIPNEPATQPQSLADLSVLSDVALSNEASAEGEWLINSHGELELVSTSVSEAPESEGGFLVGTAWGLLGSGILSGLVVLIVMAMRGRKLMAEANNV